MYLGMEKTNFLVTNSGKKKAVVLPINTYRKLLEDLHDLSIIAERRDEPVNSFENLKKRLTDDGLL